MTNGNRDFEADGGRYQERLLGPLILRLNRNEPASRKKSMSVKQVL